MTIPATEPTPIDDRPTRRRPLAPGLTADPTTPPPSAPLPPGHSWIWAGNKWKEYSGDSEPYLPIPDDITNASSSSVPDMEEQTVTGRMPQMIPPRTRRVDGTTWESKRVHTLGGRRVSAVIGGFRFFCLDCPYQNMSSELMYEHQMGRWTFWGPFRLWHRLVNRRKGGKSA